jgi:hypothetical protein
LPRQGAELSRSLLGQRERHPGAVAAFGPVRGKRLLDLSTLHPHREQISSEPGRSSAPGCTGFYIRPRELTIVEQSQICRALHRGCDRRAGMALSLQPPAHIAFGIGPDLQRAKQRPVGCFRVGCRGEPLEQRRIDLLADDQRLLAGDLAIDRTETSAVDFQPHGPGSSEIHLQSRDSGKRSHRSVVPCIAIGDGGSGAHLHRSPHAQKLLYLAFNFGEKCGIIAEE